MSRKRFLFGCIAAMLILTMALAIAGWFIRPSLVYGVATECDRFPKTDQELVDWLKKYPYVASHTVSVIRDGKKIKVQFVQNRNLFGFPAFPPLEAKCDELDYDLADRKFEDFSD